MLAQFYLHFEGQPWDQIRFLRPLSSRVLKTFKDGKCTASLDNLFRLTVLMVEKLSLYPVWTHLVLSYACCLSSPYHEPHWRAWLHLSSITITWQATVRSPCSFNISQSRCSSPVTSLAASTELLTVDQHLSHIESPKPSGLVSAE